DSSPLYRTEGLRAMIGVEALRGHWLTPTLYGEPFLTKPPGMYAAIAAASWPDGAVSDGSARLSSAVAATITALLFFRTFRRYLGDLAGWLAGVLVPISPLWLDKAPSAEIDMLQLMWAAASLLAFLRALEAEESGRHAPGWWVAALVCVA